MSVLKINWPFRMLCSGVSSSGKSTFTAQLILRSASCIDPPPEKVLYFAKHISSVPQSIKNHIQFIVGLPTEKHFENPLNQRVLMVFDDLQDEAFKSDIIISAFQRSRHLNISLILLTQNLFPRHPRARDISLNCNIIVIFFNPRDGSSIGRLGQQITPLNPQILSKIYFTYVNSAYKYIFIDLSPETDEVLRFRSSIFDQAPEIFIPEHLLDSLKDETYKKKLTFAYIIP